MKTTFHHLPAAAVDEAHVWEFVEDLSRAARVDALAALLEGTRA